MEEQRWLKHKIDGTIYGWDEFLSQDSLCEEVTAEVAFPEKHKPKAQARRKPKLKLDTAEIPEQPPKDNVELNMEASKGVPK